MTNGLNQNDDISIINAYKMNPTHTPLYSSTCLASSNHVQERFVLKLAGDVYPPHVLYLESP